MHLYAFIIIYLHLYLCIYFFILFQTFPNKIKQVDDTGAMYLQTAANANCKNVCVPVLILLLSEPCRRWWHLSFALFFGDVDSSWQNEAQQSSLLLWWEPYLQSVLRETVELLQDLCGFMGSDVDVRVPQWRLQNALLCCRPKGWHRLYQLNSLFVLVSCQTVSYHSSCKICSCQRDAVPLIFFSRLDPLAPPWPSVTCIRDTSLWQWTHVISKSRPVLKEPWLHSFCTGQIGNANFK